MSNREQLGFKFGRNGAHSARTMMLDEVSALFEQLPTDAPRSEYANQIIELNLLGKPTKKARELTFRHLTDLYSLDSGIPLYRVFRRLWAMEPSARPLLALSISLARDPLLRLSESFILGKQPGQVIERSEVENLLQHEFPDRFSPASRKSFAQNINGTWTQAGYLMGRTKKIRSTPAVTPVNAAFNLFLGSLEGLSAQRLFSSHWAQLLSSSPDELVSLASAAANRDLLVFRNAGGVMEVRFPGYLTAEEEKWLHD